MILSLLLFSSVLSSCDGQDKVRKNNNNSDVLKQTKPKTEIKVNKKYDENGNLVSYDSTYYYYSNSGNDSLLRDSVIKNFKSFFNQEYHFSNDKFFRDFFFQDSILEQAFFSDDFFLRRFEKDQKQMNALFEQMDSLKNYFFNQQFNQQNK